MTTTQKPLSVDEATTPSVVDADADVRQWQAEKIMAGLRDADEGRFASPEAVKRVIQKFIPNG